MRKSIYALVAVLAIPLAFTGCGDDDSSSSSTDNATLTSQDRQALASIGGNIVGYKAMVDNYTLIARNMGTGMAAGFAGRSASTNCNLSNTTTSGSIAITTTVTKADGSAITSCEDASAAYSTTGIGIKMTMSGTEQGMTIAANISMTYVPFATDGYDMDMTMSVTMNMVAQGQTVSIAIDPLTVEIHADAQDATPTLEGSLTMGVNGFRIVNVAFDETGVLAQTVYITKDGANAAKLVINADGTSKAYDMDGNEITG